MKHASTAIVWFRRDLRLSDNPALSAALENHENIVPVYIHAPDESEPWQPGAASNWWLHNSLQSLQLDLQKLNSDLLVETGQSIEVLKHLVTKHDASAIYWNRVYEPTLKTRDSKIKTLFRSTGIDCHSFNGSLLNEPYEIKNKTGQPYRVFSAYWRKASEAIDRLTTPLSVPDRISSPPLTTDAKSLNNLKLLSSTPWHKKFHQYWHPGEAGAHRQLSHFFENVFSSYKHNRDIPSVEGTSRLSPYLHFGEISPRQIFHITQQAVMAEGQPYDAMEKFFSEIGWREFGYYLLYHFPESSLTSLDVRFDQYGWVDTGSNLHLLRAWQQGETGIPIVDAGMRELWATGWMHNRVRMITASILSKNMGFHWLEGARWFWDTLVDADLACNTLGWQWTAGCGVDAAPYYRIFSPARQTERLDPDGSYIRQWIPELANAEKRFLVFGLPHADTGINYPQPVIDLAESRQAALTRWDTIRQPNQSIAG
jgi:deoxyribodipyrimidine photo-lyase